MAYIKYLSLYLAILLGILLLLGLSYIIPFHVNDKECYREIALTSCPVNHEVKDLTLISDHILISYDFLCCETINQSRVVSDNNRNCIKYIFLEEDDRLCSKKYQYWKRVW